MPNAAIRSIAPFLPMPGTPLTLSDVSPISASTSITCSGGTPNFCDDALGVEPRAPGRAGCRPGRAADQLEEVLVAGDERDLEAARRGLAGERAHDVVGFVAIRRQDRHAERLAGLVHQRHLIDQVGRHRAARRLVVGGEVARKVGPARSNDAAMNSGL